MKLGDANGCPLMHLVSHNDLIIWKMLVVLIAITINPFYQEI